MKKAPSCLRVAIVGAHGRMGQETVRAVTAASDMELVAQIGRTDSLTDVLSQARPAALVDFSVPEAVLRNTEAALNLGIVPIVGATGLGPVELDRLRSLCRETGTGCLIAPNFAIGAILLMRFCRAAARFFPDAEIIEMHHARKLDAPSGTALKTAELIAEGRVDNPVPAPTDAFEKFAGARGTRAVGDVPIHSVRLPGLVASQMVMFGGPGQTLSLRHDSIDRQSFMPGVLLALRHVPQLAQSGELIYGLEHLLG